jgi:ADP-ribose pyrophosphatase
MLDLTEQQLSSDTAFEGSFLTLKRDVVRLPDGKEALREYFEHPGAVAVLALNQAGELVLERQYRYPVRRAFLEIPAGKIDEHEPPAQTARRELLEETGYRAESWRYLGSAYPCIGYSNECIHYYFAEGLSQAGRQLDDGEFLDVLYLPLEQALAKTLSGEICDSKTIVGLHWLQAHLDGRLAGEPA